MIVDFGPFQVLYDEKGAVFSYFSEIKSQAIASPSPARFSAWELLGILVMFRQGMGSNFVLYSVSVPYWLLTTLAAVLPTLWLALWLINWHRRRKLPEQACSKCGYDLQGTVAAGRRECPECGERIELLKRKADEECAQHKSC